MGNLQLTVEQINALKPLEIAENPIVRERFTFIWDKLWGNGEAAYQRESVYFNKLLRDNDGGKLQRATPFSIFTAFIDLAICGLSLEPGSRALAYLQGRNTNIGTRENPRWEGRCVITISGYGELVLRARSGQIRHADNPVVVYENDDFSFGERDGKKFVNYTCNFPHTGKSVKACYMKITRPDNSTDYAVMLPEDWERLAGYSYKNNRRWNNNTRQYEGRANELYGQQTDGSCKIDTGFLVAKCIKHAFKTYPKVKIGRSTELQSEQVDETNNTTDFNQDFYGVDPDTGEVLNTTTEQKQNAQEPFGETDTNTGVTIQPDDEEGF